METSNFVHVTVISDEDGEGYIFTSGRGKLRLNQDTAKWLYSWLGRNLTPRAVDAATPSQAGAVCPHCGLPIMLVAPETPRH